MFQRMKKVLAGVAALAAIAFGASSIAGAASSSTSTTQGTTQSAAGTQSPPEFNGPAHGTAAHEDAETAVTGAAAEKARAAAVQSVGGGTAGAVTTDYTKTGYETTVMKTDGTKVEVHLDSAFAVMQGPGGHAPGAGGPVGGGPAPSGTGA
jgi:nicotinic acid phosphoribosyltransferase